MIDLKLLRASPAQVRSALARRGDPSIKKLLDELEALDMRRRALTGQLDQNGDYVVRQKDKHVWTEVFFPRIGWVAFDATEGAIDIADLAQKEGVRNLRQSGLLKVKQGVTSLEEIEAVTNE